MELFFSVLGLIGAGLCLAMYWAIEQEKVDGNSMMYYVLNGLGGFFILVSVLYSFDGGDLGSIVIEGGWVIISLMGIIRLLRKGKANA